MKPPEKKYIDFNTSYSTKFEEGYNEGISDMHKWIEEAILVEAFTETLEEHFPKGQCKERGQALVLIAIGIEEIRKILKGNK